MDYPLCNQTLTLYGKREGQVTRQVIHNGYLAIEEGLSHNDGGPVRNFLLIVPGPQAQVYVGDRVMAGIGPAAVDWETFLPAHIPGLVEVGRTRHYRVNGEICHTEAEQAWN